MNLTEGDDSLLQPLTQRPGLHVIYNYLVTAEWHDGFGVLYYIVNFKIIDMAFAVFRVLFAIT